MFSSPFQTCNEGAQQCSVVLSPSEPIYLPGTSKKWNVTSNLNLWMCWNKSVYCSSELNERGISLEKSWAMVALTSGLIYQFFLPSIHTAALSLETSAPKIPIILCGWNGHISSISVWDNYLVSSLQQSNITQCKHRDIALLGNNCGSFLTTLRKKFNFLFFRAEWVHVLHPPGAETH